MGLRLFGGGSAQRTSSSGWRVRASSGASLLPGDPNPERFEIESIETFGRYCVAVIRWPDASNYEGRKVGVYRATEKQLRAARRLDPHFQQRRGPLVPIARFEPTELGLTLARGVADGLRRGP